MEELRSWMMLKGLYMGGLIFGILQYPKYEERQQLKCEAFYLSTISTHDFDRCAMLLTYVSFLEHESKLTFVIYLF